MSHFAVLVIGEKPENQMIPYAEEALPEYQTFNDVEDELLTQYNTEETEFVLLADGTYKSKYSDEYRNFDTKSFGSSYVYPEGSSLVNVKYSTVFSTLDEFAREWHGHKGRDEVKGRYGYWRNPNAKWDWYALGGRWAGFFKAKDGMKGKKEKGPSYNEPARRGYYDQILKKAVDFDRMRKIARRDAEETFEKFDAVVKGRELPVKWEIQLEEAKTQPDFSLESFREKYHSHPVLVDLQRAHLGPWGSSVVDFYCDGNKERFIEKQINETFITHSYVKDGIWYQSGEMGWFGMNNEQISEEEWAKQYNEILQSLPDDTLLTIYDCHI